MTTSVRISIPEGTPTDPVERIPSLIAHYQPDLAARRAAFYRLPNTALDPLLKELVRLRNARLTDCAICKNLRARAAVSEGLDEDMVDAVADFERAAFSERQKAALRIVDRFLLDPGGVTGDERQALFAAFDEVELAQLAAEMMKNRAFSKVLIALGLEPEVMELTLIGT